MMMLSLWLTLLAFHLKYVTNSVFDIEWNGKSKLEIANTPHESCSVGNDEGVCIFSLICRHHGGMSLGVCRHKYFFKSCCQLPQQQSIHTTDQPDVHDEFENESNDLEVVQYIYEDNDEDVLIEDENRTDISDALKLTSSDSVKASPISHLFDLRDDTVFGLLEESNPLAIIEPFCGVRSKLFIEPKILAMQRTFRNYDLIYSNSINRHQQFPSARGRRPRIIGGRPADFGVWPWHVSFLVKEDINVKSTTNSNDTTVEYRAKQKCGGVLISRRWVLTAGHCTQGRFPDEVLLRFGDTDRENDEEPLPHVEREVKRIINHPKYDWLTYDHDVSLIEFDPPIEYAEHIRPICLSQYPKDNLPVSKFYGKKAFVTGWGTLYEGGPKPYVLHELEVPIISPKRCNEIFEAAGLEEMLTDIFICAGYVEGERDACVGDSGGPLVVQSSNSGRWILAGLVSWGNGCGEVNSPGVYTNIIKVIPWIQVNIMGSEMLDVNTLK